MIKKNTKIIFEGDDNQFSEEMIGGMPLSEGETVNIHKGEEVVVYVVRDKKIDYFIDGDDKIVNITYTFNKK